ncbi:unnamed protein product [Ostreobium quekettii]|uniref:TLDc domain-containing protein n=1 Tax=Ostreobium quekettii TaxID=121088 RepID=A0A8S1JB80_9CHLO|nr:unnamed protein product [Ostreobium quekettii]
MKPWSWLWGSQEARAPDVVAAERSIPKDDLLRMKAAFKTQTGASGTKDNPILPFAGFKALLHMTDALWGDIADSLCRAVDRSRRGEIAFEDFVVALRRCERGSDAERAGFAFGVLDADGDGRVGRTELEAGVRACAAVVGGESETDDVAGRVALGATKMCRSGDPDSTGSLDQGTFEMWSKKVPSVSLVLCSLLQRWPGQSPTLSIHTPRLEMDDQWTGKELLLKHSWLWLLCGGLPSQQCLKWHLLFHSSVHGKSFNTFMGKVKGRGATLMIVRDSEGHCFGGFAPLPWKKQGSFYGDYSSFLFTLDPHYSMYKASGSNDHFQWCGQGFSQLPNGVGFGGQVGHFGLFIDSTFDGGMSRPSATFSSPCLASAQTFGVKDVECWLVEPVEDDELAPGDSSSVLDKYKEDQRVMELAGKQKYSDGYRD